MKVLMFQRQFVPLILSGAKTQTVRRRGPRQYTRGEAISLRHWEGVAYASPQIQFARAHVHRVVDVRISRLGVRREMEERDGWEMGTMDEFAQRDGFQNWEDLWAWFQEHHKLKNSDVFLGRCISWAWLPED